MRLLRRVPRGVWIGGAGLVLLLLIVLLVNPWGAGGTPPAVEAVAPTAIPSPTPAPTVTPVPTPTRRPFAGDIADLALRFDVEEALAHAEELAADGYAGRQGGSPGGRRAAEYIAGYLEALGLEPAGTDAYLQPFMLPYAEEARLPELQITGADGVVRDDLVFGEDFRHAMGGYAAGGEAEGEVVWLGGCGTSDYDAHEVRGDIVMCRHRPGVDQAAVAAEEGAEALLLVTGDERRIALKRALSEAPKAEGIPTLLVSDAVFDLLLGAERPSSDLGLLDATARVTVELVQAGEAEGVNVLAALPGAAPALRDRVLIVGAHFDHLGADPDGAIYNGANDNASGTAALLEIARSWREANYRPAVTVLFAAWDGEEQGLLGARHYVMNPRYPLSATIGMIQLDMVGMADAGTLTYDGAANAVGRQLAASAERFEVPTGAVSWSGGSDHGAFLSAGVDAGLIIWDAAEVAYYHTPEDTAATLQPERLRQAGVVVSHAALALIRAAEEGGPAPTAQVVGRSLYSLGAAPLPVR